MTALQPKAAGHGVSPRCLQLALFVIALLSGLAAAWPPLHLVIVDANLATYFHENIGYRFFWVLRAIDGAPGDFVHPGQGVLLSLIQSIYYLAGKALGLDLWGRISLFGRLTLGVPAVATALLGLAIALDRRLDLGVRAALVTSPLVMGLSHAHTFSYDLYPDYHAYAKLFFLLFTWRWLAHRGWSGITTPYAAGELGAWAGLLGALKVNVVFFPAGLLLASLGVMAASRRRAPLRLGLVAALAAAVVMGGAFLLHYDGNLDAVARFFAVLLDFAKSLAKSPAISIDPFESWSTHSYSNLAWLSAIFAILCLLGLRSRRGRPMAFAVVLAILGGVALAMAYWRGGGASYFDAVVIVSMLCVLATATFDDPRMIRAASLGLAVIFVLWPAAWVAFHWQEYESDDGLLPRLELAGDWQRGLYNWNLAQRLPVYVLMPSNSFPQGTIEDMMLRGMTNFSEGWGVANQNPTREALFPEFHIVSYNMFDMFRPPPRYVFMWVTGERPFPLVDQATLDRQNKEVDRLLSGRRREACYRVTQAITGAEIISCVVSLPDNRP